MNQTDSMSIIRAIASYSMTKRWQMSCAISSSPLCTKPRSGERIVELQFSIVSEYNSQRNKRMQAGRTEEEEVKQQRMADITRTLRKCGLMCRMDAQNSW